MNSLTNWIDRLLTFFTTTNLQLLLLIGSGILAISLLVLALTRWGHSRPVWKCVILSFVAHILLIGYAYGTRLMFETPAIVEKEATPMRVNLIDEQGESVVGEERNDAAEQSWDQFVNEQAMPSAEELERPSIDTELVIEEKVDLSIEASNSQRPGAMLDTVPQAFHDPEFADTPQPLSGDVRSSDAQVNPQPIQVARRGDKGAASRQQPQFEVPTEIERQEVSHDLDTVSDHIRSAPVTDHHPFVSDLVDSNAEFPIAPDSLPSPAVAPRFENMKPLNSLSRPGQFRSVANPRRIGDGQPVPQVYSLRNSPNRAEVARKRGGSIETERAVALALKWLAEHQQENGSWSSRNTGGGREDKIYGHDRDGAGAQADCGITALATLAFLASGQSHLEGQYQREIQRGLEFLARSQRSNGDLSGDAKLFAKMYCHGMSLLALSEALAMTGDQRLLQPVQKGVNFTVAAQNRKDGGWRYAPGDSGDMSQFGWQVLALHSAKLGNATVPEATFDRMETFLESCTSGVGNGLASYRPRQGPSTAMTAEALLCRYFLKQNVAATTLLEASRRLATERPTPHHVNLYYWYYGTLAMYHVGGNDWEQWNSELKRTLLTLQNQSGSDSGSWPANGVWGGYGGQVYATAMATLSLEVYYRYLPIYQEVAESNGFRSETRR